MPSATTYDGLVQAFSEDRAAVYQWYDYLEAAGTSLVGTAVGQAVRDMGGHIVLPTVSGIAKYRAVFAHGNGSTAGLFFLVKLVHLGSLDISGASGTFTHDTAMPTRRELGVDNVPTWGQLLMVVRTALNAAPGSIGSISYVNQAGTSTSISTAFTLSVSASSGMASILTLATGDYGVRDVTAATRTSGTTPTGILDFYGLYPLGTLPVSINATFPIGANFITGSFCIPDLLPGDELALLSNALSTQAGASTVWVTLIGETT